jgi:predicted dienelactone hydrolase
MFGGSGSKDLMNYERIVIAACCLSLLVFGISNAPASPSKAVVYKVGVAHRSFTPPEPYNWREAKTHELVTDIWYPAGPGMPEETQWIGAADNPFAIAGKAVRDAAIVPAPEKLPLILLSHGTGASSLMMAWFGTALASHGFIAAAVNHPGNNALEDYTLQGFCLWWERATDLSTLLNLLLADSTFGSRIDARRIGAAGFSLGGFTVLELAGGIGETSRYLQFCKSPKADGMCVDPVEFPGIAAKAAELIKSDPAFQAALAEGAKSHRDARVRAVFAMAPALGPAFDPASLARITIPVKIVVGNADKVVPIATSAQFFASHIPGAQLTIFQDVGHYTFLATCAQLGRMSRPDLCLDNAGILRDDIHTQTNNLAWHFFETSLK